MKNVRTSPETSSLSDVHRMPSLQVGSDPEVVSFVFVDRFLVVPKIVSYVCIPEPSSVWLAAYKLAVKKIVLILLT